MFCDKCGFENKDNAKFCKKCGHLLSEETTDNQKIDKTEERSISENIKKFDANKVIDITNKAKAMPKNKLIGGAVGVVALLAVLFIVLLSPATINLDKYITIDATGYDGYGTVNASIDWEAIEDKYGDKISYKSKAEKEYGGLLMYMPVIETLEACVDVEFSTKYDVYNGDKIEYVWHIDEELEDYVNCKVKAKNGTYTVVGLQEIGVFDAFADIEISFEGVSSQGYVSYDYLGEELNRYDFSCDAGDNLKNGDTVTICIDNTNEEYYAMTFGMIPEKFEQEYVVSGLGEYVNSYSELNEEQIAQLDNEALTTINSYIEEVYEETSLMSELKFEGYSFVTDVDRYYNNLILVYSGTASSTESNFEDTKVYFPVKFKYLYVNAEGVKSPYDTEIMGRSYLEDSWYTTKGYTDASDMYSAVVKENAEVSDSLKEFDK